MNPTFSPLRIQEVRRETDECVSVQFELTPEIADQYRYLPGQYVTLKKVINGEELRRSYSICSGLNDGELRVAIKKVPDGRFSTFANVELKKGDILEVMTPMGKFTTAVDADTEKSFVFFAAGSGITPVLSLVKTILETAPKSDVTLFYGNKGFDSIIFREQLEELKNRYMLTFRLIHIFSVESLGNELQNGFILHEKVEKLHHAFLQGQKIDEIFVCGPEPMIFAVSETFEKLGYPNAAIHFELFTAPTQRENVKLDIPQKPIQLNANVKIILDGEETLLSLDSNGLSILEAGHKAGADLPFACKGGVCCTCKAKVIEGTASMDVNYALEKDEVEAGYILTCQAHPTSDKLVVSFDD